MPVLIILTGNAAIAIISLIILLAKKSGTFAFICGAVILLCPVVGVLFLSGSYFLSRFLSRNRTLAYADISFDGTRRKKKQQPDFMEEVNILPLREALVVSGTGDRRRALLSVLKKESFQNISSLSEAVENEDSETSHYAAAAVLTAAANHRKELAALKKAFEKNASEKDPTPALDYLGGLEVFLQSGIMERAEKATYTNIHSELMAWLYQCFQADLRPEHYVCQTELLLEQEDCGAADLWVSRGIRAFPQNDEIYYTALRLYYVCGDHERFRILLSFLMNSQINISNRTLQLIRFFTYNGCSS